jgi:hypothetical protein
MPTLNCGPFEGRHYETGTLRNALACRGARAPHTGQPYSEALLLGVSGGIAFGYFTFEYKGYLPHVALLPRNTFAPFDTMLERLAIPHEVQQTTNPDQGEAKLIAALDAGQPAVVWADRFSLPYTRLPWDDHNWMVITLLAHGYEGDDVLVADRSCQALRVPRAALRKARGRVKEDRHRLMTIEPPNEAKLPAAAQKGIWQCISLFTEAPPRGAKDNFGFAGYDKLAKMLTNTRHKMSWARQFEPGSRMFHALAGSTAQPGAYDWIMSFGAAPDAERGLYADFLDEAALILERPQLGEVAEQFRAAAGEWRGLATAMLPDEVPLFGETRRLHDRRNEAFVAQGDGAGEEIERINARLEAIAREVGEAFPLSEAQAAEMRQGLAERIERIRDVEREAVEALQKAMG